MARSLHSALLCSLAVPAEPHVVCRFLRQCAPDGGCARLDVTITSRYGAASGKVFMDGNRGRVAVLPLDGEGVLRVAQPLDSRAVQATSIRNAGKAIHSRHTVFDEASVSARWDGGARGAAASRWTP